MNDQRTQIFWAHRQKEKLNLPRRIWYYKHQYLHQKHWVILSHQTSTALWNIPQLTIFYKCALQLISDYVEGIDFNIFASDIISIASTSLLSFLRMVLVECCSTDEHRWAQNFFRVEQIKVVPGFSGRRPGPLIGK